MQRATAASPTSSPSTPNGPPSKKQRLSSGAGPSTPSSDAQAMQEALAAEEFKRVQALERQAADAGETKWVLSYQDQRPKTQQAPMRIVTAGFSAIDSGITSRATVDQSDDDDAELAAKMQGRRSFGRFNRTIEVTKMLS